MITYIKTAFRKPKEIYIGRNMKNSHFFYLILLVSFLITVISLFHFIPTLQNINDDFNEIKESIPTFELNNNEIQSESESYIYQTDSMVFYFDPDDNISTDTIDKKMSSMSTPVSTAILKNGLYINVLSQEYFFPFNSIENLTTNDLQSLIASFGHFSRRTLLLFIIILFIAQLMLFGYKLIFVTLFVNILSIFSGIRLKLSQNFKITLLAIIPPVLILSFIQIFIFPVRFELEIILIMSLFIYYISIKEMKNRLLDQTD